MADVTPSNRLVRKRNSNLQKQLEVTLHLLGEEYRQSKERMYKEERDCGKFLQSLYSTVPGLMTYGQPDTRAMNSNALLKERRYSMSVSVVSDGDDLHHPLDPPFKPKASPPSAKAGNSRTGKQDAGAKSTSQAEAPGAQPGNTGEGTSSVKPSVSERNNFIKKLRENSSFLQRPSTAGNQRKGAQNPAQDGNSENPSSGRFKQKRRQSPSYGKGAYSEYDRYLHERVQKRFDVIFDPETEARKVNLSTLLAPSLVVEGDKEDGRDIAKMDGITTTSARIPHPHVNIIEVNGEEFHLSKKPSNHRRVVWSANPHKTQKAGTGPHSARTERRTCASPATDRQASSKPRSSSHTAMAPRNKTPTVPAPPGRPDSRIQQLALQKNLPMKSSWQDEESGSSSESDEDADQQAQNMVNPSVRIPEESNMVIPSPRLPEEPNTVVPTPRIPEEPNTVIPTPRIPEANTAVPTPRIPEEPNTVIPTPRIPEANTVIPTPRMPEEANTVILSPRIPEEPKMAKPNLRTPEEANTVKISQKTPKEPTTFKPCERIPEEPSTRKPYQKVPEQSKTRFKLPERSKQHSCVHHRKEKEHTHTKHHCAASHHQNQHQEPNRTKCSSPNLLQVPGPQHQPHHHHPGPHHQPPHHHHDGPNSDSNTSQAPVAPGQRHSIPRPSSRLSEASDITPPVELWSKLLKAGLPGRASNRPKTAPPSKSELSHRSMPAPRQTVVGILAQIENQKASTRNMINTSKELQRVVKKLVPWEQVSVYDLDDW